MKEEAPHVLVVDDEPRYLRLLRFNLEADGYQVTSAVSGEEALALLAQRQPDLVLLDLMLPGIDGFEACRRIRELVATPIIVLTAKGAEEDKVKGLRLGADDYVTKPFAVQELLARVEAVLRRVQPVEVTRQQPLRVDGLEIDFLARRVVAEGREIRLSPTEFRLLACLAASPGVVLTREDLLERVWGPGYRRDHEILRVALWRLRHKLEPDPAHPRYIVTRAGVGYLFSL